MGQKIQTFSASALSALGSGERSFYVYCLTDLKKDKVLFVGTGSGNRIFEFDHYDAPTAKALSKCKKTGRFILAARLSEAEAHAAENVLAAFIRNVAGKKLKSHPTASEDGISAEEWENRYGFTPVNPASLNPDGVILAVKIPETAHRHQDAEALAALVLENRQVGKDIAAKIRYIVGIDTASDNAAVCAFEVDGFETREETRNGKTLTLYDFRAADGGERVLSKLGLERKCLPELKFAVASDKAYIRPQAGQS